ncbi:cell division protein [Anopheles sinensis]|uniref:Cell division protein n=1 Tax=Anopheles sinensis TaxID=74873 RepID=A0A084WFB3_ANOSI|nr:cell division protein [Anopheles sinensis]
MVRVVPASQHLSNAFDMPIVPMIVALAAGGLNRNLKRNACARECTPTLRLSASFRSPDDREDEPGWLCGSNPHAFEKESIGFSGSRPARMR